MPTTTVFTTIRSEGALLPPDLLQRIVDNQGLDGLSPESYHRSGEKINEAINRSWNSLQGAWANFRAAQERLPESDLGTSITRERWLLPLFRELEYGRLQTAPAIEIAGRSYPISHHWENVPIHLVSYKADLDKKSAGITGAASASPHSLVQVFLNRSEDHSWGFVSNGYKLRLLRDNASLTRQAYVEFDLEAMMEGEVYSDFVLLWLLCHQSRVEGKPSDCWLEKWMKAAEEQGTRALEDLRKGVEAAITALGLGFLEHPANYALRDKLHSGQLTGQDYYRQLLRLVYRLLFLFVAEDRDLLLDPHAPEAARERYRRHYSTQRLRRIAESFKGTNHPDLYEALRLIMRLLSDEHNGGVLSLRAAENAGRGLALVPLGSFLFSEAALPDILPCQLSNSALLTAIRALSLREDKQAKVYRTVDYKHLGPEELGSVYESLLELHPQINVTARRFALDTAGGNERKTTGSYYTPTSLINALLDSALNPVLADASKKGETAILALKICDPACGSGHFLIAAAHRIAKALATVRTGEEEPAPAEITRAKRDVIAHCIYGVDINPMAVELCKVNLWMEALEPGKPLSFLEHRIQVGNSLLGTTPALMANGIPDDAFSPIEGDDRAFVSSMKRVNREERRQREANVRQLGLFDEFASTDYAYLSRAMHELDSLPDSDLAAIRRKEAKYQDFASNPEYTRARLLADAWCAAFVWQKTPPKNPPVGTAFLPSAALPITDLLYRRIESDPFAENLAATRATVLALAQQYQFFHWHIAFPDVFTLDDSPSLPAQRSGEGARGWGGWNGGFDVLLGNPPWERIKIQEKEWFAQRAPEIANAANAAARRKAIAELEQNNPELLAEFAQDKRKAEGESHFVRVSNRYPLCGRGDVNTYTLFAESSRQIINGYGRVGMIVPSGIATDDTTKFFFQDLVDNQALVSLYDFENRGHLFSALHTKTKFCLLTMSSKPIHTMLFCFMAIDLSDLDDKEKVFSLTTEDLALINPNTKNSPLFRSRTDVNINKIIYQRMPIIFNQTTNENVFGLSIISMFHMANDSGLFSNHIDSNNLRLYESKMFWHYDHRWATYNKDGDTVLLEKETLSPDIFVIPRYYINSTEVEKTLNGRWKEKWLFALRNITDSRNERSVVFSIIPYVGVGHSASVVFLNEEFPTQLMICFNANLSTFVFDYAARQKIGGTNLTQSVFNQFPVMPPHSYTQELLDFIVPRVLELTYTAWDLQPFAQDLGYQGAPFVWDEERRFLLRCELDALYFHLYQISREDVDYIMETFPIVKRKDIAATSNSPRHEGEGAGGEGYYRTKDTILAMYDEMSQLPKIAIPAPKSSSPEFGGGREGVSGEGYLVPDVSQWTAATNPPPAHPDVAHRE